MKKEARDGEGNVMADAEIRDEVLQGQFIVASLGPPSSASDR